MGHLRATYFAVAVAAGLWASSAAHADNFGSACGAYAQSESPATDATTAPLTLADLSGCRGLTPTTHRLKHKVAHHGLSARAVKHHQVHEIAVLTPSPTALRPEPVRVSVMDDCSGPRANLLCPGYQLVGSSY